MKSYLNLNIKSLTTAYQALTSTSDNQIQSQIINTLPEGLKNRIQNLISSNPSYSKERAVHEVTMEELEVLEDLNLKDRFYGTFYRALGVDPLSSQNLVRDFDRAELAFKVLSEELDVKFLDIEPILTVFEDEMSKDLIIAALDEVAFFNFQTPISEELDSRIIELLSTLKRSSSTPALFEINKSIIIERVTQVLKKIDIKEWSDFDHLLLRNTVFDPIGVVCTTKQETLDLAQVQSRFEEAIKQLEAKEPRLSEEYKETKEADWDARKASWESFKERIKTYPAATLFDNTNHENRQKQYYTLGLRFVASALKADSENSLGFCLDHIDRAGVDSFLETCLTGWVQRISQLESVTGVKVQDPLVRVWEISKEVRRNLVDRYISENFAGGNVHAYEKAKAAVNKLFNLGYSQDDLGAENEGENKLGLNFVDLDLYIQKRFVTDFLGALESELKKKVPEEIQSWFGSVLEAYSAAAKNDPSLLINSSNQDVLENTSVLCEKLQTNEKFAAIVLGILSKSLKIKHHEESKVQGVILSWMQTLDLSSSFKNNSTFLNEPYSGVGLLEDIRTESLKNVFIYLKNETLSSNEWLAALKLSLELGNDTLINLLIETKDVQNLTEEEKESLANLDYQSAFKLAVSTSKVVLIPCLSVLFRENMDYTILELIKAEKIELVEFFLSKKIQITDASRCGALNYAVYYENLNLMRLLLPEDIEISMEGRGEIVRSAVDRNNIEMVRYLLPEGTEIPMEDRGQAVERAAKNSNLEMIMYLLPEGVEIPKESRGRAVIYAADNNNLSIARLLLSKGAEISMDARSEALELAIRSFDLDVVKLLLSDVAEISMEARGLVVFLAAHYNDLEFLRIWLPEGAEIDMKLRETAIERAITHDNLDMIRILLPQGMEASLRSIYSAIEFGKLEVLRYFLPEDAEISVEKRGAILFEAVATFNLELIRYLLPETAVISTEVRGRALGVAAYFDKLEIIKLLLPVGLEIASETRGFVVEIAVERNNLEMLDYVLPVGAQIPLVNRSNAVIYAAKNNNLDMLRLLLAEGVEVAGESISQALVWAADDNNLDMLRMLVAARVDIPKLDRSDAVSKAVFYNNLDMLQLLLTEGVTISEEVREDSIRLAALHSNLNILRLLLPEGVEISMNAREIAVKLVVRNNKLDILRYLLPEDVEISIHARDNAIKAALDHGNLKMACYLLPKNEQVSNETREMIIRQAVFDNDLEIVTRLFDKMEVNSHCRGFVVCVAADNNNLDMVRLLLPQGLEISMEARGEAISHAVSNSNLEMLRYLLPEGSVLPIQLREEIIGLASVHNNQDILQWLRSTGSSQK